MGKTKKEAPANKPTDTACDFKTPQLGIIRVAKVTTENNMIYFTKFFLLKLDFVVFLHFCCFCVASRALFWRLASQGREGGLGG